MWPDRVLNPEPLALESNALPTALCGPAPREMTLIARAIDEDSYQFAHSIYPSLHTAVLLRNKLTL